MSYTTMIKSPIAVMEYILEQPYPLITGWCGSYCVDTSIVDTQMVKDYYCDYDLDVLEKEHYGGEDAIYNPEKPRSIKVLRSIPSGLFSSSMLDDSEYFSSTVDSTLHAQQQPQSHVSSSDTCTTATIQTTSFDDGDDWDDYDEDSDSAFGGSFSASILVLQNYRLPLIQEETIPTTLKSDKYDDPKKPVAVPSSPSSLSRINSPIMDMDTSSSELLVHRDAASATAAE